MTLQFVEQLLDRRGLLLVGLPATGRSALFTAAATHLECLGPVAQIPGAVTDPSLLARALHLLVANSDSGPILRLGGVTEQPADTTQLFLLIDDFGHVLRSSLGDRIDLLLGTATFASVEPDLPEVFTAATLLRAELRSPEDSMCLSDRAGRVFVGQSGAPFLPEGGLERFGGWAAVAGPYHSDRIAGLGRARTALRRDLLRKLVGALRLEDIELVLSVVRRQVAGAPRRWDEHKYLGLAPLVVQAADRAVVPEEFVNAGLAGLLDFAEVARPIHSDPQPRAKWLASRCGLEENPLWWDGHFGEQGTHPVDFLTLFMREVGRAQHLRILAHQDAIDSQPQRFEELRAAIHKDALLLNVDVRSTSSGSRQGLHDRQLYLPGLRRAVKLPIYTRLAGPFPSGDYTETWTTGRSKFDDAYTNIDRAFQTARRL